MSRNFLLFIFCFFIICLSNASALDDCSLMYKKGVPCIPISKTPNTSSYNQNKVTKYVITKQEILRLGALDINDILKSVPGIDVFQSGQKGQQTSIFTRGSESNHTLVLLNGVPINDQSVTDGLHDFGQDFIQTIQQVDIYKGSNGAHFGPSAIAGAINLITDIDYNNGYSISGFNDQNNSLDINHTYISENQWHINLKGSSTKAKTNSSIAGGNEKDGVKNNQINLNTTKWFKDNLKFKSTLYSRKTKADYDGSSTDEHGYITDNRFNVLQSSLENISNNKENYLIFHYHNYDREYENSGFLDEYYSQALFLRAESRNEINEKISLGIGSEYKYDWGYFENRGNYNASTRGHMKDLGIFANTGIKLNNNQSVSIHARLDDHNSAGRYETYKINFLQRFKKIGLGLNHSTGLRNPTLYELYGSDNYGIKGNVNLKPEKSKTNELYFDLNLSDKIIFSSTGYRTNIYDRIESNSSYTIHENMIDDLNQEGIESEISYKDTDQSLSIFTNFAKSRTVSGEHQSRRPDLSYGANYNKKIINKFFENLTYNLNYKFTDEYLDWNGTENSFQKSTDILDLSISRILEKSIFSLRVNNLLNERYEKPATYSQDGRKLSFNFRRLY